MKRYGYCCVGVSEGLQDADGKLMAEAGTKDAFGHAQLGGVGPLIASIVKDKLKYKYHWAVADYLQRAARHIASKTDLEQSYAVGKAAVEMALAGRNAVMPTITRVSDKPYRWKITEAPLDDVANVEKMLPPDFITPDGFDITEKARRYLAPLIRGEAPPPFKDGLPQYVRLQERRRAEEDRGGLHGLARRPARLTWPANWHNSVLCVDVPGGPGRAISPQEGTGGRGRFRARPGNEGRSQAGADALLRFRATSTGETPCPTPTA